MSNASSGGAPLAGDPLTRAVLEIDEYAAGLGWDQSPRLYALVDTARLRTEEPELSERLGLADEADAGAQAALTPIEQDEIPSGGPLDEFLATIAWPEVVVGCALTVERLMLPPSVERALPKNLEGMDADTLAAWAAEHPEREEVRMT